MKLDGPWTAGYVLERQHTISSEFLGHDSFGHPQFDSKYSALGELVYRLKNRGDKNAVDSIADTAVQFINERWKPEFDLIVPMPPSRRREAYQPVIEIANAIGTRLEKPVDPDAVSKIKETPQLKDVYDFAERKQLLRDAFRAKEAVRGKAILLVDDLYRSGATAVVVAQSLLAGGATHVCMLAVTKTRTRR
ncbi:MAG: ComF family protein [Candidatus Acidiferrales bacterium]